MTKTPSSSSTADEHRISDSALINKLGLTFGIIMAAFLLLFYCMSSTAYKNKIDITPISPTAIESPTEWEKGVEQGIQSLDKNQAILDQRINDLQYLLSHNSITLGMIATFFGALITVAVIFFTLRQGDMVREVVDDAKSKVGHMDDTIKRAEEILEKIIADKKSIESINTKIDDIYIKIANIRTVIDKIQSSELDEEKFIEPSNNSDEDTNIDDLNKHLDKGAQFFNLGNFNEAITEFREGKKLSSNNSYAKSQFEFNIGKVYLEAGSRIQAKDTFLKLLDWIHEYPLSRKYAVKAHLNLGSIYFLDGMYAEAIEEWKKITNTTDDETDSEIVDDIIRAHNNIGHTFLPLKRTIEAKHEFEAVLNLENKASSNEEIHGLILNAKQTLLDNKLL